MSQKKVDQYKARKNGHSKEQKKEKQLVLPDIVF